MRTEIELIGMEFFSRHGCLESERVEGNVFSVDVRFSYDALEAARTDDLSKAVDYSGVYRIVSEEMERPSNLLENVALRISEKLRAGFPQILSLEVSVSKKNPPVEGRVEWSTARIVTP